MKERPPRRNWAVSIRLGGLSLESGVCGYQVGEQALPNGFLKVSWQLVSLSKDGIF